MFSPSSLCLFAVDPISPISISAELWAPRLTVPFFEGCLITSETHAIGPCCLLERVTQIASYSSLFSPLLSLTSEVSSILSEALVWGWSLGAGGQTLQWS